MTEEEPEGELTIRTVAMPADTNVAGDIFGGWVLSQMDIAAGIAAVEHAKSRVATVGVNAMSFLKPVHVGDILCVYTKVERVGRTSMAIKLDAWVLRQKTQRRLKVTEGVFTFVALDENGKSRPVPPLD